MAVNDGGSAFPLNHGGGMHQQGMTLRDYFAAKAMQGLLAYGAHTSSLEEGQLAAYAFQLADAMMKAREVSR